MRIERDHGPSRGRASLFQGVTKGEPRHHGADEDHDDGDDEDDHDLVRPCRRGCRRGRTGARMGPSARWSPAVSRGRRTTGWRRWWRWTGQWSRLGRRAAWRRRSRWPPGGWRRCRVGSRSQRGQRSPGSCRRSRVRRNGMACIRRSRRRRRRGLRVPRSGRVGVTVLLWLVHVLWVGAHRRPIVNASSVRLSMPTRRSPEGAPLVRVP